MGNGRSFLGAKRPDPEANWPHMGSIKLMFPLLTRWTQKAKAKLSLFLINYQTIKYYEEVEIQLHAFLNAALDRRSLLPFGRRSRCCGEEGKVCPCCKSKSDSSVVISAACSPQNLQVRYPIIIIIFTSSDLLQL
jgi:hypothetical protein